MNLAQLFWNWASSVVSLVTMSIVALQKDLVVILLLLRLKDLT